MDPTLVGLIGGIPQERLAIVAVVATLLALGLLVILGTQLGKRRAAQRAVAEARGHLRTVTGTMREGVIAYDLRLQLTFVNPAFERLTGYSEEDLRDQEFLQYIHPEDRPALTAEWERLAEGGSLPDQEYRVVTRTGQERWSSGSWEPLRDESGRQIGYLGTEFDITERKLAEEAMRLDTELFQAMIEVQQSVAAAGVDSQTMMRVIADRGMRLTGASGAVIESIEGEESVPQVHIGITAPRLRLSDSLSGLCVRTGELQRSDDVSNDPRIKHDAYRELGVRSQLVVPLKDEQRTHGVLKVVSSRPQAFTDRDAKALQLLSGLMGAALGHAAAYEARQLRLEERTQSLQESEQRFKQLVDVAQEGIWLADDHGVITYVNQRMAELLGYQNGAMLGRRVYDFIDPASRSGAQRVLARPSASGGESRDLRFLRQDGGELWGLVSASPIVGRDGGLIGTVGMVTDITERKQAEERLRRSAERLAILHDMGQAILAAQTPAEIGRAALGRIRRMVPCQRCSIVLFDFPKAQAHIVAGYADGNPITPAPIPLDALSPAEVLRRGTVRYVEDIATLDSPPPIFQALLEDELHSVLSVPLLADGEAIGELTLAAKIAGAFDSEHRDIALEVAAPLAIAIQHARLRDELALKSSEAERRMAERGAALRGATAELETLLYSVSHDLRAPVRHIGGFAELLLKDGGPGLDPAVQHHATRIREGASRMGGMLDDLVQLSRLGRQDMLRRPVDFNLLVEDVVGLMQSETGSRIIDWMVEPLPMLQCDPALAKIAIANLVSNAVKFTRTRGRASIRIRPVRADDQDGIAVQDNGVGFKMAYAGKLFGLFQRLHRSDEFEGDGAGLAFVQRIAQRHGGRVWAESEVDEGATFYITFGGSDVRHAS